MAYKSYFSQLYGLRPFILFARREEVGEEGGDFFGKVFAEHRYVSFGLFLVAGGRETDSGGKKG